MFNGHFTLDKRNARFMGVCAGLADYLGVETIWLRLGFVLGTLFGFGTPAIVYLAIGLIADRKPEAL